MPVYLYEPDFAVGTVQCLVRGVVLSSVSTSPQVITTLQSNPTNDTTLGTAAPFPTSSKFVITSLVWRDAGAALNAGTTFSVGWGASSTNVISASTALQSLALAKALNQALTAAQTSGTAGDALNITFAGTLTSNTTITVDVLGYFTAA